MQSKINQVKNKSQTNQQVENKKKQIIVQQQPEIQLKQHQNKIEVANAQKYNISQYLNDQVIYNLSIFLSPKEMVNLRRINKQFNKSFLQIIPELIKFNQKQIEDFQQKLNFQDIQQQQILKEVDYAFFQNELEKEHLYKSPDKAIKLYLDCFELIFKVLNFDLSPWKEKKFTYQMKIQAILDQFKKNPKLIDFSKLNDQQIQIIKSQSQRINLESAESLKCKFSDLINFCWNLINVVKQDNYESNEATTRRQMNESIKFIEYYNQY